MQAASGLLPLNMELYDFFKPSVCTLNCGPLCPLHSHLIIFFRARIYHDAVERFMVRWHKDEADMTRKRHASAVGGAQGNGKGGGYSRKETAVDESRKETVDRVARYQAD